MPNLITAGRSESHKSDPILFTQSIPINENYSVSSNSIEISGGLVSASQHSLEAIESYRAEAIIMEPHPRRTDQENTAAPMSAT